MIDRFFNNLNDEQKEIFNNILESYCFEVNDYSTANKLGAVLTKALPLYFFRYNHLTDESDIIFRIFHMKTSFTTPITVSRYSEFIKVII